MTGRGVAVVLLSGGLDSAVALALSIRDGFSPYVLTIDYSQRHRVELDCAKRLAEAMRVGKHLELSVDLTRWGGSSLTAAEPVPVNRDAARMGVDIPSTYVPARNTIFLSLAMAWAETLRSSDIFIGAHSLDYSGYPDCRPEYFAAFAQMANLATKSGVEGNHWTIHTPLLHMTKSDIVRQGLALGVPFEHTMSCYQPQSKNGRWAGCGICDSCIIRRNAFADAGAADPVPYC